MNTIIILPIIIAVIVLGLSLYAAYDYGTGLQTRQRAKAEKKRIESLPKAYRK